MSKGLVVAPDGLPRSPLPIRDAAVVGNRRRISGRLSIGPGGLSPCGAACEEAERSLADAFRIAEGPCFALSGIVRADPAFADPGDGAPVDAPCTGFPPERRRPALAIRRAAASGLRRLHHA